MTPLDTHELTAWVNQQLPDAHPLTEAETDRARLALREHVTLDAARRQTAACRGEHRTRRARAHLRRRGVQLGLAGLVTAGAAVAVVGIGGSGSAVSPATANAATVIANARRALVAAPGSVLEYQLAVQKADDAPVSAQITEDPGTGDEIVVTSQNGQPTVTTATENKTLEFFNPARNLIARVSDPTPAETQSPTSAQAYADDLDRPGAQVDKTASYDGQPAVQISWPDVNQGTDSYYCDPSSYQPIAMLWNGGAHAGGTTITWTGYRPLTGSANASAASLTAQHPSARIRTMPYSTWSAALNQLSH